MNNTVCLNGRIQRAAPIDIFQRGTHRLIDITGRVIATLRSLTINLFLFEGQFVTVCGIFEGNIEGVPSILVTAIFNQIPPNCPCPNENYAHNLPCPHCSTDFTCKQGKHCKYRTHKKHYKKH